MILKAVNSFLETKECESFSIAFLFHSLVLLLLSLIFSAVESKQINPTIISSIVEETIPFEEPPVVIEDQYVFDEENTSFTETVIQDVDDTSLKINDSDVPQITNLTVDTETDISQSELLSEHFSGVSSNIGGGLSTQSSTGGALDRLTAEIIRNAESRDLVVVWLFDSSISLNHQRQQIYNRFEKIIDEIELSESITKTITHSICSFGNSIDFLTGEPTQNCQTLKDNISSIKIDESGIENTFSAIAQTCKKYAKSGSRLMVIVFTDEVGDDMNLLDATSNLAKSKGSMIYVVGSPAPFGKSTTQFKFVEFDPKYESVERWVEIQQGPESLADTVLDLHSLPIDEQTLDSGFGPFALSKLCADTGGIFFSVHPNRNSTPNHKKDISPLSSYISRFFDENIMRLYKPDYRSLSTQTKENTTHITKQALIRACAIRLNISGEQTLRFKAFNEGMFAEELSAAQRFSARLEPKINEVYNILMLGEPAHKTLAEDKRWMASYCLSMGRILATKCRIESYNLLLAEAKSGLKKKDPKSNIWILLPSTEFQSSNSLLRKHYEASQKYLKYVVDNFPNTPWALIASEELNTPVGYAWFEEYQEPPKPNNGGGGNNNPKDDMAKPKLIPKPQRKINKI